jgi:hypothetical protein
VSTVNRGNPSLVSLGEILGLQCEYKYQRE